MTGIAVDDDYRRVVCVVMVPFEVIMRVDMRMIVVVMTFDVEVQRAADIQIKRGQHLERQQHCHQHNQDYAPVRRVTFSTSKQFRHSRKILPEARENLARNHDRSATHQRQNDLNA